MRQVIPQGAVAIPDKRREEILDSSNWIGEIKFDGSRYILQIDMEGKIALTSRRESVSGGMVNKVENLPHVIGEALKGLSKGTILDGEVDVEGDKRNFKQVQGIMGSLPERAIQLQNEKGKLIYRVFDVLEFNGEDVRGKTLHERKQILGYIFDNYAFMYLRLSPIFQDKRKLFKDEIAKGNEGVMLKNLESIYQEDKSPTNSWYKMKPVYTYDGIVKGYTQGTGKYKDTIGALVVYQYVGEELKHVADVSGMTDTQRKEFKEILDRGENFIIEFQCEGLFKDTNRYRFPTFVRVRTDKPEKNCIYGKA